VLALATFVMAALLASCAQPGYDQAQIQRKLVKAGLTQTQARCVTDGLDNAFPDPNQLVARSAPNVQQEQATAAVLKKCGVNVSSPTH
jgi:hypothetical protein